MDWILNYIKYKIRELTEFSDFSFLKAIDKENMYDKIKSQRDYKKEKC